MAEINFSEIEKKWQKKWEEKKVFEVSEGSKKKKFYVLEMYPYPSGKPHMGHAFNYTIGDILARFKRMVGFNVLHPMGYDSFGLPAENAAIKAKSHPKKFTEEAIANFNKQFRKFGFSYCWDRMVETHKPDYYKWDQWIFLKMFEKGLAFKKTSAVNWCEKCNTVLANEQVHDGKCWRHSDTDVKIKHLEQWFFKITNYADELYEGINDLENWPEDVKAMQRNWIGKSLGTEIDFEIENPDEKNKISNVIIVHGSNSSEKEAKTGKPENERHWKPWLKRELEKKGIKVSNDLYPQDWNPNYEEWKKVFEKNKIDENSVLIGHSAGTAFILRWLNENKRKVKKIILIAPSITPHGKYLNLSKLKDFKFDSSLTKYFDETITFYADDDDEDIINSAKEVNKKLGGRIFNLSGRGHFTLGDMKTEEFPELLDEVLGNQKFPIFTTRPDTIFGVTFMVISSQHPNLFDLVTKEQKKDVEKFLKKMKSTSEKELADLEKEGVFTGSYAINPMTKEKIPIWAGNFVVADYGSGMVMAVPAHDQRDFEFAKKYDIPIKIVVQPNDHLSPERMVQAYTGEGNLINSEKFNGLSNEEAKEHITKYLEGKNLGRKVVNFRLRDWLISRQRFWGTPIPIVYCDKCGVVPVPEKDLPVKLPDDIKFTSERNPLVDYKKFVDVKCPKCNGKARRETDTMDTFVNSSWYFLRYCDAKNDKKIFDSKKANYWMPIDQYIGGKEHACMHLIYFRFYTKFLRDLGLHKFDEPTLNYFSQGMVHGSDGFVMSKSRGNGVDPFEEIEKYSADTLRFYLISTASPENDFAWSNAGMEGAHRFVKKIVSLSENVKLGKSSKRTESKVNDAIKKITSHIELMEYNLAVIKLRHLIDALSEENEISKNDLSSVLKLISPFCPHITEELWEKIGGKGFISLADWPVCDEKKIDAKIEEQEKAVNGLIGDINNVLKIVGNKNRVFVYALPNEKEIYYNSANEIAKRTNLDVKVFAVNDKEKYDPENKSKKAKPNRPSIYLE